MFVSNMHIIKILVLILIYIFAISAFNISPKPNLIIQEPKTHSYRPKLRSSFFGISLLLRSKSLFVGAPRAQTTIESQKNINETGLLYKCSLELGSPGHCVVYLIDKTGNKHSEDNDGNPENEKKDYQWLGGSLDGGSRDSDPLIVCAPRMIDATSENYFMHGICYRTPDTTEEQPTSIKIISPLKGSDNQIWGESFLYAYGESGFSVHWTGENDEVLIGAPGINNWKGSLIRYRAEENKGNGGIAKRDLSYQNNLENKVKGSFKSSIPNPNLWHQSNDSYFGYSGSSGYFNVDSTKKLLYITSAPRANNYDGEVYVYDIIDDSRPKTYNIKKYKTFSGKQFGEYFGSSVLTDDLNGDGLTDIIISAPLYNEYNIYDCGAVYVYINENNLYFEEQLIISPDQKSSGRFGTSISLLGDINQDGFNDIAISAPFIENGKVFIYFGNKIGLENKPSQVILAPKIENFPNQQMFGYGLSKGLDIDGNGYNDLTIGAPNAERVYLFKTYPIVKIEGTIDAVSREIQEDQKDLKIKVCVKMIPTSKNSEKIDQKLRVKVEADVILKRVKFQNGNNFINDIINLKSEINVCKVFDANLNLNLKDIFKPIELKMNYDLVSKVPNTEEFCEKCFALDPLIGNFMTKSIFISTGCANKTGECVADLSIKSKVSEKFVVGSSNKIQVQYSIRNEGETAYAPQLIVTSLNMSFAKIPSMCKRNSGNSNSLICDLNQNQPMHRGKSDSISIHFDSSSIDVKELSIKAEVTSAGEEKNIFDNSVDDKIIVQERSSLDIIRTNQNQMITLEDQNGMYEFINKFEIKNNGPSPIKEVTFSILVPLTYLIPKTTKRITVIDVNNITFAANYASFNLKSTCKWYNVINKNCTINLEPQSQVKQAMILTSSISDDLHANKYDSSKFNFDLENFNIDNINNEADINMNRKRRSTVLNSKVKINGSEFERFTEKQTINHELTGTLPFKKVINFNCQDQDESDCLQIDFKLKNFRVSNERGVNIELKYIVDLDEVNNILVEEKSFFFIENQFNVFRIGDQLRESLEISNEKQYLVISKHRLSSTPIWVIILSVLAGLLLLALIIFGLYKFGFFERKNVSGVDTEGNEVSEPMISHQNNATET